MRARIDIDHALADRNLLGAALGDLTPWKVWRVVLRAAFALGLGTRRSLVAVRCRQSVFASCGPL